MSARVPLLFASLAWLAFASVSARAQPSNEGAALADAAKRAAGEKRYCEALELYTRAFASSSSSEAKYLFNAAEVAFAADDKVRALTLYREVLAKFPSYKSASGSKTAQQRVNELGKALAQEGVGTTCPTGAAAIAVACGNAVVDGTDQCDDGNAVSGDGCDANCTASACGNGVVAPGEACDDGNAVSGDGCDANCTASACGNGVVGGAEQCDDGNGVDGDGCSGMCMTEAKPAPAAALVNAPAPVKVAQAAPPAGASRVKVIVLDLKAASLTPAEGSAITSLVTVVLSEYPALEVVSGADVREMLALEGQKQSIGCEESMSCLAEIAGALGARIVAYGQLEKLGSLYILSMNLQDTAKNKSVGRLALQGAGLDAIATAAPSAVKKMVEPFLQSEGLSTTSSSARAEAPALTTVTGQLKAPSGDHAGLAWTGGIIGVIGAIAFAGTYYGSLLGAATQGAPPEVVDGLKIPVAGKPIVGAQLSSDDNCNNEECEGFANIAYGLGGVEALAAVAAVGGTGALVYARLADNPTEGSDSVMRWGFVLGGLGLAGAGVAVDAFAPTSSDGELGIVDFAPPVLMLGGATLAAVGLLTTYGAGAPAAAAAAGNAE